MGKSTLFNRLVGRKEALVDNTPGLTRDRREAIAELSDLRFRVIDTAGLEKAENESLESLMMQQTEKAADDADLLFMVIDGRAGVTSLDEYFAGWIRRKNKPVIMLVNKCENDSKSPGIVESYALGLGEPIAISAEHGIGIGSIYDIIAPYITGKGPEDDKKQEQLQIAIIGRPNVGKSTLFNQLLGDERSITGDMAGITRDSVYVEYQFNGQNIKLVDTAGIRKQAKRRGHRLEDLSVKDSMKAVQYANIVVLLLDATQALDRQDLTLADYIISEGRGMVIAVNKWDLVEDKKAVLREIEHKIEHSLYQARGVPIVTLSALHGRSVNKVIKTALDIFTLWDSRISTGKLNRWLERAIGEHPPPMVNGRAVKLRYITQIKSRPPTFAIFTTSKIRGLPESYLRYLTNSLRSEFSLNGVPIRLLLRKGDNPYKL